MTRALAHDLAADGITVNCVVPGLIGTPRPKDKPEPAHHLTHQTITGNRGLPEDVAATVRLLCGPGARYVRRSTPMAAPIWAADAWLKAVFADVLPEKAPRRPRRLMLPRNA
ncbi:SDR family oxidoreductase [Bradyrhizobium icense]|uniref:SDR family oxidoreductase n=1 Tax=Bradyrhizobium icense TaxID=1274631 RepID=UPI00202A40F8|nr:SDR family oxidoreductase [Bradyrhizobium icense]